jgi:hypothetical protein
MNYIGEIKIFAGEFNPPGFIDCDGSILPIAYNKELFSVIGYDYTESQGGKYFQIPSSDSLLDGTKLIICVDGNFPREVAFDKYSEKTADTMSNGKLTNYTNPLAKVVDKYKSIADFNMIWGNYDTETDEFGSGGSSGGSGGSGGSSGGSGGGTGIQFTHSDYGDEIDSIGNSNLQITRSASGGGLYNPFYEYFYAPNTTIVTAQFIDQTTNVYFVYQDLLSGVYNDILPNIESMTRLDPINPRGKPISLSLSNTFGTSPVFTLWNNDGWDNLNINDVKTRTFTTLSNCLFGRIGTYILDTNYNNLIMFDILDNKYYKIEFTSWTQNGSGGGFQYYRTLLT